MSKPIPRFPSFVEAFRFWLKLGLISFGGPAGQIAIMHRELVEVRRWISERHFLHALNYCMLLPGPEAQQLATYLGWRLHGARGGIVAGALFVLPSMVLIFALSWVYVLGGDIPWLAAILHALLAAVIAIIADAVLRIGRKTLRAPALWVLAALSFVAIYFLGISFVFIIFGAALIGLVGHLAVPRQFPSAKGHGSADGEAEECVILPPPPRSTWKRTVSILALVLVLWWAPVFGLASTLGWQSTPAAQGVFFSKAALVTFGGAYAVLPYVAQEAVERHEWLTDPQMMTGLALAESTPGPLIMVLQFVGFLGGWQQPGELSPAVAATICSIITTWVTFLPCFLFIFLGGPFVETLGNFPKLGAALTAVTAAVVGVIFNLGVRFTTSALWPEGGGFEWMLLALAILSFVALRFFSIGVIPVIAGCALAGLAGYFLTGSPAP